MIIINIAEIMLRIMPVITIHNAKNSSIILSLYSRNIPPYHCTHCIGFKHIQTIMKRILFTARTTPESWHETRKSEFLTRNTLQGIKISHLEHHLQNAIFGWYVSSLEGILFHLPFLGSMLVLRGVPHCIPPQKIRAARLKVCSTLQ